MSNDVKSQSISIQDSSKERVAFDLMKYVLEETSHRADYKHEALGLYAECLRVVQGFPPQE